MFTHAQILILAKLWRSSILFAVPIVNESKKKNNNNNKLDAEKNNLEKAKSCLCNPFFDFKMIGRTNLISHLRTRHNLAKTLWSHLRSSLMFHNLAKTLWSHLRSSLMFREINFVRTINR